MRSESITVRLTLAVLLLTATFSALSACEVSAKTAKWHLKTLAERHRGSIIDSTGLAFTFRTPKYSRVSFRVSACEHIRHFAIAERRSSRSAEAPIILAEVIELSRLLFTSILAEQVQARVANREFELVETTDTIKVTFPFMKEFSVQASFKAGTQSITIRVAYG